MHSGTFKLWHRYIECCRFRGYEAQFLNSFRLKRVSDFIFHYISGSNVGRSELMCGEYIIYDPPLFPLFFHRIKPRGRRRESLSIFHSNVATKIFGFPTNFLYRTKEGLGERLSCALCTYKHQTLIDQNLFQVK